jgi:hypothetical protein
VLGHVLQCTAGAVVQPSTAACTDDVYRILGQSMNGVDWYGLVCTLALTTSGHMGLEGCDLQLVHTFHTSSHFHKLFHTSPHLSAPKV